MQTTSDRPRGGVRPVGPAHPDGRSRRSPLHECEWAEHADGPVYLVSARLYLDWGQWVGLKPNGLVNAMNLDLTTRPEWQSLTRQDLRIMASRAMGVAVEEVEFFYADEDLVLDGTGHATIRQRKDAFYVLEDGTWERARFMSCMSAMHWATIDYLPVVELFKSLLPGTGSAAFELIRGLYDDQNPQNPRLLQYRGIPPIRQQRLSGCSAIFLRPRTGAGRILLPSSWILPGRTRSIGCRIRIRPCVTWTCTIKFA